MTTPLKICRIDCASDDATRAIRDLRTQLSPRGDVVSPQGRARTVAAFGEPLTPQQVVLLREFRHIPQEGALLHVIVEEKSKS